MNLDNDSKFLFEYSPLLSSIVVGENTDSILDKICSDIETNLGLDEVHCAIFERHKDTLCLNNACNPSASLFKNLDQVKLESLGYNPAKLTSIQQTLQYQLIRIATGSQSQKSQQSEFQCVDSPLVNSSANLIGLLIVLLPEGVQLTSRQESLITLLADIASAALTAQHRKHELEIKIEKLENSNEKFSAFTKVMPDLALIISQNGVYEDVHGSPDNRLYVSATEIVNKNVHDIFPSEDAKKIMHVIKRALATNSIQEYEYSLESEEGVSIFEGRVTPISYDSDNYDEHNHVLWMARDVTIEKQYQQKITQLAYFDPLTQLPNRRMFNERLELTVKSKEASHEYGAILFLDLDDFKRINDSLGHSAGDMLLIDVSSRLKQSLRKSDVLARIGGDEFVVLIESIGGTTDEALAEIAVVAKKIQDAFEQKYQIENLSFKVSSSIGICFIDGKASAQNIMKFADTAMYNSKRQGGDSYSFYDPKKQTLLDRQLTFESDIVSAIERREFCAFFQPQVNLQGKLCGAEALIRWIHPTKGLIPPNEFISVAEQFGLIQKLQDIVLEDMCQLFNTLDNKNMLNDGFTLSINISHSQFRSPNLKRLLVSTINRFNVPASAISLEITESMLSHDIDKTVQLMTDIAATGFTFSIDDFGTGYSNLSNLHVYPVKELKIDKSFIDRISDSSGLSIVETIINLAKNLGMQIVAEGVENEQQLCILKDHDVDVLQGYYFAKPMSVDQYIEWHQHHH